MLNWQANRRGASSFGGRNLSRKGALSLDLSNQEHFKLKLLKRVLRKKSNGASSCSCPVQQTSLHLTSERRSGGAVSTRFQRQQPGRLRGGRRGGGEGGKTREGAPNGDLNARCRQQAHFCTSLLPRCCFMAFWIASMPPALLRLDAVIHQRCHYHSYNKTEYPDDCIGLLIPPPKQIKHRSTFIEDNAAQRLITKDTLLPPPQYPHNVRVVLVSQDPQPDLNGPSKPSPSRQGNFVTVPVGKLPILSR